jgi:tetratricopeptide (TPR) repeat protein
LALDAGRRGLKGAERALLAVADDPAQPPVVRGTALSLLAVRAGPSSLAALRRGLADPDPLVRLGALEGTLGLEPASRLAAALRLLNDPILAVRIEAGRVLADVPAAHWRSADRSRLAEVLVEYRATLELDADLPQAQVTLGALQLAQGDPEGARRAYQTALALTPWFAPAYVNLADLERIQGREEAGETWLRRGIENAPEVAETHHALGLLLIRTGRRDEALPELARAARLAPENARFALVYALALDDRGDHKRALAVLDSALIRHPGDLNLRAVLAELEEATP